jgi:outer membrane protein OmpA-like peptidoglycan-associated protein
MTAYDPSLIPPRGTLLQRLGFGRARAAEFEQEPAPLAQRSMAEDAIEEAVGRIARFLKEHRLDVTPLTLNAAHAYVSGHDHQLRLTPDARVLLKAISETVSETGGDPASSSGLTIRGHTDALAWRKGAGGNNWALSASRAEATRPALVRNGLPPARFRRIEGVADGEPLVKDNPADQRNRRISITVLN